MTEVKTLEEHKLYVKRFAGVSFFFARKHLAPRFPDKSLGELIKDHTPLLYHGLNYAPALWTTDPECLHILAKADEYASLEAGDFEEKMWQETAGLAEKRAELNYPAAVGVKAPASWNCGSLKYDHPQEHPDLPEDWIVFHIANAVGPQSIFADPGYLPRCFMLLLKETQVRFNSQVLYTSTWLNGREEFLRNFPQEWRDNLEKNNDPLPVPAWHFGWWGQLVTGRGTINPNAEKFVRENGRLRYACCKSHCSYKNMIGHLEKMDV